MTDEGVPLMSTLDALRREPDLRSYPQGALIFKEGDPGDCLFAVVEGMVEIRLHGNAVEQVAAGGVFGEMALIDGQPRSASAIAVTDCQLAVIPEKRFLRLVEQTPRFALEIMRVVTERLRRRAG